MEEDIEEQDSEYYSNYWTMENILKREEKEQAEKEKLQAQEKDKPLLFYCSKCRFVFDEEKEGITLQEKYKEKIVENKCPKCGKQSLKIVTKQEYEKINKENKTQDEKSKQKEHKEKVNTAYQVVEWIDHEREKLFKDLKTKLENKEITPERFLSLLYNISCDIMLARKNEYTPDWQSERKRILDMGQMIVELYDLKQTQTSEINNYGYQEEEYIQQLSIINSYNVKDDIIYDVYHEKYILNDEEKYNLYCEQSKLSDYLLTLQKERKIVEKSQERIYNSNEQVTNKIVQDSENKFLSNLKKDVNKIIK